MAAMPSRTFNSRFELVLLMGYLTGLADEPGWAMMKKASVIGLTSQRLERFYGSL